MNNNTTPNLHPPFQIRRNRLAYAALIAVVIVLGITLRKNTLLPPWCAKTAGDALWALCVYFVYGFCRPSASPRAIAFGALLFSFAIEFSELYHAPWINHLRGYRLGALILGFKFHWVNLLCYLLGIALGVVGEWWWIIKGNKSSSPKGLGQI